ncbi:MAG TPA: D-aminoacylase [Luteitalea sp.]|nr:D-aminoacylase [Luteitalea sp.]
MNAWIGTLSVATLAVAMTIVTATAQSPALDVLITGGRVVDGTGNPAFDGDLGIRDGRIVELGRVATPAKRTIDATGLIVAPGFIDIHNHSDTTLLDDPDGQSMLRQGVTTMVLGEGGSAAPSARWPRLRDYFTDVQRRGVSANIGTYVGSSQIWTQVRGPKAGPPSATELDAMRRLMEEAMADGAFGVSSSLSGPPGVWIDTDTLVALAEVAGRHGGRYSTHMRTEGTGVFASVAEAIAIGRRAKLPVDIIHLKIAERSMWGRMPELVGLIAAARAEGQLVEANVYPYRAGQNDLASIVPPWAHEGGATALVARLRDRTLRARLEAEILGQVPLGDWYNHYTATGSWDGMLLVTLSNEKYRQYAGKRMHDVIAAIGKPPIDVLFELLVENGGSVPTVFFHHSEDDMRYALAQPFVSIGSDGSAVSVDGQVGPGHPHPRFYGTFPRVLGRYVRETPVLSLEDAVRKMTSANAAKVRQFDRGLLRPGAWADVTIFDAARVIDHATFEAPRQYATGIEYVLVNGTVVIDRGTHTHARAGRVLRGPGATGVR